MSLKDTTVATPRPAPTQVDRAVCACRGDHSVFVALVLVLRLRSRVLLRLPSRRIRDRGVRWPEPLALLDFFKRVIRPRIGAPAELEDSRPPRFAQLVRLLVHSLSHCWLLAARRRSAGATAFAPDRGLLNASIGLCLV